MEDAEAIGVKAGQPVPVLDFEQQQPVEATGGKFLTGRVPARVELLQREMLIVRWHTRSHA